MTAQAGDTPTSKLQLRREFRRRRLELPLAARRRAALLAARRLARSRAFRRAARIALYLAVGSELSTLPLIALCQRQGKRVYLPRIGREGRMRFVAYDAAAGWRRNRHGIREPRRLAAIPLSELDLVLLPLVAFDATGTRLGAGGGYYDRLFAGRRGRRPLRVGYAYAVQQADALPRDPWDQPLHAAVTERTFIHFPEPRSPWPTG